LRRDCGSGRDAGRCRPRAAARRGVRAGGVAGAGADRRGRPAEHGHRVGRRRRPGGDGVLRHAVCGPAARGADVAARSGQAGQVPGAAAERVPVAAAADPGGSAEAGAAVSHETDPLRGSAGPLARAAVGVYAETAPIPPDGTGIVLGRLPAGPGRVIGLASYPVADDDSTDSITGVQARMRAGTDPPAVLDLSDAVFDVLHNRRTWTARGVRVEISWRNSEAWIGQDASGRMERTANYYFRTIRSGSPHLND